MSNRDQGPTDGRSRPRNGRSLGQVRIDRPGNTAVAGPVGLGDETGGGFWASGRVLVTAIILGVLVLWGTLYLTFRDWRARYRERAEYGVRLIVPAIDPLAEVIPAGAKPGAAPFVSSACAGTSAAAAIARPWDVTPAEWRKAVAETRMMLISLVSANVLDTPQMATLATRVSTLVAQARPESARSTLNAIWDEAEAGAGPVITARHRRPSVLGR